MVHAAAPAMDRNGQQRFGSICRARRYTHVSSSAFCMLEMDGMDYSYMKRVITLADTSVTYVACIRCVDMGWGMHRSLILTRSHCTVTPLPLCLTQQRTIYH